MPDSMAVHIQAGEPVEADYCPHCGGDRYTFPLIAILRTGVTSAGAVTICPACDTPARAVAKHRTHLERTPLDQWSTDPS